MKRRHFLHLSIQTTALATIGHHTLFGAGTTPAGDAIPFYVRGLALMKFSDPDNLLIALPQAPHHAATFTSVPKSGDPVEHALRGHVQIERATAPAPNPGIDLPAVVHMNELYKGAVGDFAGSPTVISIPWSAVRSVSTDTVSEDRWTFVWKDTGEEVVTFRPRKVAESVRIDLASDSIVRVNDGKLVLRGADAAEFRTDFVPTRSDMGGFPEHFQYYMPYIETPMDVAEVVPRKIGRAVQAAGRIPAAANGFAARTFPFYACFVVIVD